MIYSLPLIKLPDAYTQVLRTNLSLVKNADEFVLTTIRQSKMTESTFAQYLHGDHRADLNSFYRLYGWKKLRDQLGALYLEFVANGQYSKKVNFDFIQDVLSFELEATDLSTQRYDRVFLLAFYLKFCEQDILQETGRKVDLLKQMMPVLEFAKTFGKRAPQTDWLLLMFWHFYEYMGLSELKAKCKDFSYHEIYSQLSSQQQSLMTLNLVNYSLSIGDREIFTQPEMRA